jgi:pimeloyl-ACP methyl ester carboxylesterase
VVGIFFLSKSVVLLGIFDKRAANHRMNFSLKTVKGFSYIDQGQGETLLLLHGLFGALSNWDGVITHFSTNYRVVIPMLPIYDMPILSASIDGLVKYVQDFVSLMKLDRMTVLGNSLGGHVGLVYTLRNADKVTRLVLTGSSGLFENSMGGSFPKRGSFEYVKERVEYTFFDPATATAELVQEVFETTKSIQRSLRIVSIAKSAQRHNVSNELDKIIVPTLLVWGLNDTITPPYVAYEFHRLIKNSELRFVDHCCHAPMMEHPVLFNEMVDNFLSNNPV